MNDASIKVSVLCITYNHEAYIRQALEGFVSQETSFAFEVLIHDDCSTDRTAQIIREYEQKYPEIIKPIYQTINQYSQGVDIEGKILLPLAKGEYIAWCEGDDYWTDPQKLQRQYEFLCAHPECSACVHNAVFHAISTGLDTLVPGIEAPRAYSMEEIVMEGGAIFATNSLMMRKEIYLRMPDCFHTPGFGDYQLFIYAAIEGTVFCLAESMSTYNWGVSGSWSDLVWNNKQKRQKHMETCINMLELVDAYYGRKYTAVFTRKRRDMEYAIYKLNENKRGMKRPEYREFYRADQIKKIKVALVRVFPFLLKAKRLLRGNSTR